jgi:protein-S-isoprenylcysteine O-methyltransferase Ste14
MMNAESGRSTLLLTIVVKGVVGLGAIAGTLFGVAGRVDWPAAWVFISLFAIYLFLGAWWFVRYDPDLLKERMTTAPNVPIGTDCRSCLLDQRQRCLRPRFDAGRFRWSEMATALQAVGAVALVAALAVIWWCTAANRFLSANARIQSERGHRVIQQGPYRFVRHPMYTSLIVLMIAMALILGSWLAVVPAGLIAVLLVVRTSLEDRMLTTELVGYREYANQVHDRLLPGLW